jgi:hypothetical protein
VSTKRRIEDEDDDDDDDENETERIGLASEATLQIS